MPRFIADFHLHSKYSRATSPQMELEHLHKTALRKGITVLGSGDFTHPEWFANLKEKLVPAEPGLYKLANADGTRFVLSTEVSCIYSKRGGVRKIHILILVPTIEDAEKINARLGWIGNLKADGRPILGLDAKELVKIAVTVCRDAMIIPGHIWTPWFSLFGSKSGFDSIEECFEEYTPSITALETGLSADPPMCWRLSALDRFSLVSNGDSHSPRNTGREANVFDTELSYPAIQEALKQKDPRTFLCTIEFFPEEGKYHFDGHRNCNVSLSPEETKKLAGMCPVCAKPLTIGVLNRVASLADRPMGFEPAGAIPFKRLVPLEEIIARTLGVGTATKEVQNIYLDLTEKFGSEFNILLDVPFADLEKETLAEIARGIALVREGKIEITPGYDGVFGKIEIFPHGGKKRERIPGQEPLL